MINLRTEKSICDFKADVCGKKLIIWGAGFRTYKSLKVLEEAPLFFIDKDRSKKEIQFRQYTIQVHNEEYFLNYVMNNDKTNIILLITPSYVSEEIVEWLNSKKEFHDLTCYLLSDLIDNYTEYEFQYTADMPKIPPVIHYCWFGNGEIPEQLKMYMETWKEKCPNYKIKRWNEDNYDVGKNKYLEELYKRKLWSYISDYARMDILYSEGGIYLDTDVELIKSLDDLRNDEMFVGFTDELTIGDGAGIGAVSGHWLIKELRDYYLQREILLDGKINSVPNTIYLEHVYEKNGFSVINSYQKKNGVVIYPAGIFVNRSNSDKQRITNKTVLIHHGSRLWDKRKKESGLPGTSTP